MTNLDPQTTGDFWDAYLRAVSAGTNLAQVSRTFPDAPHELCSPVSEPVSYVPRIAPARNNIRLGPRCAAGSDRCGRAT